MPFFVYFLRSEIKPDETYIGYSNSLERRLWEHNNDERNPRAHTRKFRPWALETFVLADTEEAALIIEAYFKSNAAKEAIERRTGRRDGYAEFVASLTEGKAFGKGDGRFCVQSFVPYFSMQPPKQKEK